MIVSDNGYMIRYACARSTFRLALQVEELLTLSPEALTVDSNAGSKVFGLIFLFHFDEKVERKIEERIREKRQAALVANQQETALHMRDGDKADTQHTVMAVDEDGTGTAPPAADAADAKRATQQEIPERPTNDINPESLAAAPPFDQNTNGNGEKKKEDEGGEGNVVATAATIVSQSDKSEPTPSLPPPPPPPPPPALVGLL